MTDEYPPFGPDPGGTDPPPEQAGSTFEPGRADQDRIPTMIISSPPDRRRATAQSRLPERSERPTEPTGEPELPVTEQRSVHIHGIHTVGVPVADQDRALDFYVGTLGFEKRLDVPIPELGSRWIEVAPAGAPVTVALVRAGDELPAGGESGIRFTTGDAAALHASLTAAGVAVDELLDWPGVPPMFAFRDPDGNGMEIVQDAAAG